MSGAGVLVVGQRWVVSWMRWPMQVDNWVYDEANSTFIEDPEMQKRLMDANPNSFRKLV